MAYKKADSNSFGEYQLSEGFGSAVTGKRAVAGDLSIKKTATQAQSSFDAMTRNLKGYEGYPTSYSGYGYGDASQDLTTSKAANAAMKGARLLPGGLSGSDLSTRETAKTLLNAAKAQGYEGVEDDAFAGYDGLGQLSLKEASDIARKNKISDDVNEFSGLGQQDELLESWHTHFNAASLARTDTDLIKALRRAVRSVSDDTPDSVKRDYYESAMKLLRARKKSNLRYLDVGRAEIESNLGWLLDPRLPKTGGFDAVVSKVVASVGGEMARNEPSFQKMKHKEALGNQLKEQLTKSGNLFGEWTSLIKENSFYLGLGALGLGAAYLFFKNRSLAFKK